ncbi:MAG TPA: hypothetical protein VMJ32_09375 [Pirellulales bacterium]|nr:hypothetical protein [Pirellulales bacterium]
MGFFNRIFGKRSQPRNPSSPPIEQAVLVYLDGVGLPNHIYQECELATIEDRLMATIEDSNLGEFDGNEIGPKETVLYMYGPDAEKLFAGIELTLRNYPLCQGARIIIRHGGPGANQREIKL